MPHAVYECVLTYLNLSQMSRIQFTFRYIVVSKSKGKKIGVNPVHRTCFFLLRLNLKINPEKTSCFYFALLLRLFFRSRQLFLLFEKIIFLKVKFWFDSLHLMRQIFFQASILIDFLQSLKRLYLELLPWEFIFKKFQIQRR